MSNVFNYTKPRPRIANDTKTKNKFETVRKRLPFRRTDTEIKIRIQEKQMTKNKYEMK